MVSVREERASIKKKYTKPFLFIESFELLEHIAGGCTTPDNFEGALHSTGCGYNIGDAILFSDPYSGGCKDEKFASMIEFAEFSTAGLSYLEIAQGLGLDCYNSMYNPGTQFFSS